MSGFDAEIIAIEDTDRVGWIESATTIGEVPFQCVNTFVDNVLAALGTRRMSLLHIQVHGTPDHAVFGPHRVSMATFDHYRPTLSRLTSKFANNAWVDLRACQVGQNLPLLRRFRQLWNVGIVAGRGYQYNAFFDANTGRYQIVFADGREDTSFFVPPHVEYSTTRRALRGITSRF